MKNTANNSERRADLMLWASVSPVGPGQKWRRVRFASRRSPQINIEISRPESGFTNPPLKIHIGGRLLPRQEMMARSTAGSSARKPATFLFSVVRPEGLEPPAY